MANKEVLKEKKIIVKEIIDNINTASSVLIWEYKSLNVNEIQNIKRELRTVGAKTKVYKNTLAKLAFKEKGYSELLDQLVGQNAFAFASKEDEIATARIINKYMKDNEGIVLKAGIFEGQIVVESKLMELAALPSRDGLLSMLLSVLQANTRNLAYALSQVALKAPELKSTPKVEETKIKENKVEEKPKVEETKIEVKEHAEKVMDEGKKELKHSETEEKHANKLKESIKN